MSYDVYLYHTDVRKSVEQGSRLENLVPIPKAEIDRLVVRLANTVTGSSSRLRTTANLYGRSPAVRSKYSLFSTEVAFSIPYWSNSEQAIIEARQDALELSDTDLLAFYDSQNDEWVP